MLKKKEQKTESGLNKEFEQALATLNPGDNLEIERPKKGSRWLKIVAVIVFISLIGGVIWFFIFSRTKSLADELPGETSFYISLSLPRERRWGERAFFWQTASIPNQSLSRLYPSLNIIGWTGVEFGRDLLPLFEDKLEIAKLSSGSLILRTHLKDIPGWLQVVSAEPGANQGELAGEARESFVIGGWWQYLTKNPNKIYWFLQKDKLYISDDENWRDFLGQTRSLPKFEPGVVQAFVKDIGALGGLDASNNQFVASGVQFPLKLIAKSSQDSLVWYAVSSEKDLSWAKKAYFSLRSGEALVLSADNLQQVYQEWQAMLGLLAQNQLTKNINELEQIAKEFYGLDLNSVLAKVGERRVTLDLMFDNNWSLKITDKSAQDEEELLGYLQKFASSFFAITHPEQVEHKLADGSTMVELRASSNGLEWQPLEWSGQGKQYSFYSLRGQGEENGYFIGFVPTQGYFLTSSLSQIGQLVESQDGVTGSGGCLLSYEPALGLYFKPFVISSDSLLNEVIQEMSLTSSREGILGGCLKF